MGVDVTSQRVGKLDFETYSNSKVNLINDYLDSSLAIFRDSISQRFGLLIDAMEYSLRGAGKRLRPLLVMASAEYVGLDPKKVLPAAAAIEYIHNYSLIHDDLPALDDDDTRRGKPSSHAKFGEAVAILTGDALLTEAFTQMMNLSRTGDFQAAHILNAVEALAHYSGVRGMVGGQLLDVSSQTDNYSLPEVEFIHIHKTGALILASTLIPAKLIALEQGQIDRLRRYGEAIGLAFQISDDVLDNNAEARYSRGPRNRQNPTYANVMSPSEMREKLCSLVETAKASISDDGRCAEPLIAIADFVRDRKN